MILHDWKNDLIISQLYCIHTTLQSKNAWPIRVKANITYFSKDCQKKSA
jgi:hypothetical protein